MPSTPHHPTSPSFSYLLATTMHPPCKAPPCTHNPSCTPEAPPAWLPLLPEQPGPPACHGGDGGGQVVVKLHNNGRHLIACIPTTTYHHHHHHHRHRRRRHHHHRPSHKLWMKHLLQTNLEYRLVKPRSVLTCAAVLAACTSFLASSSAFSISFILAVKRAEGGRAVAAAAAEDPPVRAASILFSGTSSSSLSPSWDTCSGAICCRSSTPWNLHLHKQHSAVRFSAAPAASCSGAGSVSPLSSPHR